MKNFISWKVILLAPLFYQCNKTGPSLEASKDLSGQWQLESIIMKSDTIKKPSVKNGLYDISITFKEKGNLEATSSTNYLTGFYETDPMNSMYMGLDGTQRKETSWGNAFTDALAHVSSYQFSANNALVLTSGQHRQMIFTKVK